MKLSGLVEGATLDQDARDVIAKRWNWLRIVAAAPALPMALAVGVLVDSTLLLGAGLMAIVLAVSIQQRHQPKPALLLVMDTLGTVVVLELLGVPDAAIGIPFTVIWVVAWLTTSGPSRLAIMVGAAAGYAVTAIFDPIPGVVTQGAGDDIVGTVVGAYFIVLLFAVLIATLKLYVSRQDSLTEARAELERLVASKDEFIAAVSHELRTPLTTVVGFATELRESWDAFSEPERHELIGLIAQQGDDLSEIVEDLLTSARADAGTLTVNLEHVDVHGVVAVVAKQEGLHLRTEQGNTTAVADPTRLRQIVRNLATNAERYGGGERWVEVRPDAARVHIRVCDNGRGIPGSNPERVFEPYERAEEDAGQPASVGLGLSVARTLARLMGGDVAYHREGSTTVFDCTLRTAAAR